MGKIQGICIPKGTGLSPNALCVLQALGNLSDGNGVTAISRQGLARAAGLTESQCRTALRALIDSGLVSDRTANRVKNRASNITLLCYGTCNLQPSSRTSDRASGQATPRKPKPGDGLEKRAHAFGETLVPYLDRYGKDMVRAFYDYWTEPNQSRAKMRWELERTWDVGRRLERWARNDGTGRQGGNAQSKTEAYAADNSEWEDGGTDAMRW